MHYNRLHQFCYKSLQKAAKGHNQNNYDTLWSHFSSIRIIVFETITVSFLGSSTSQSSNAAQTTGCRQPAVQE